MILFFYIGAVSGISIFLFLFYFDYRRMVRKKRSDDYILTRFTKKIFGRVIAACIITILVSAILPRIIWTFGEKEESATDRITESMEIYFIPDQQVFATIGVSNGKTQYIVSVSGSDGLQKFDSSQVDLIDLQNGDKPRYEKIGHFKRIRLKNKNMFTKAVNEMYCGIVVWNDNMGNGKPKLNPKDELKWRESIMDGLRWKDTLQSEKIKLYVPEGSVKKV